MYELKKIGKVFTSKSVGTGPSSHKKRIYRAAVSQRLRNTDLGYRHTLRICNVCTFSTATMVKLTSFSVTCIRTLPVLFKTQA